MLHTIFFFLSIAVFLVPATAGVYLWFRKKTYDFSNEIGLVTIQTPHIYDTLYVV
jgi:hypothetical protein